MVKVRLLCLIAMLTACSVSQAQLKKTPGVWTDPEDPTLPIDFKLQGEYAGDKIGVQIIALGKGRFQGVVHPGGLPGTGWDGKNKSLMDGKLDGSKLILEPATGKRAYLAQSPDQFSATSKFPPVGHENYSGSTDGESMSIAKGGEKLELKKIVRKSSTLGLKPAQGAIVLYDGSNKDEWNGGRIDSATKNLNTDGNDIVTKRKFNDYSAHLEFMLPYRPDARGQGRGNSGFYQVLMYEVQVLDSFGLDGKNNECGGVYTKADPKLNMCLPPLTWQTYDVEFQNAVMEGGKVVKKARVTAKLNGILIHDSLEIDGKTGGARNDPEGTPGPILLQGHGNPLQYRNIWIVEKK